MPSKGEGDGEPIEYLNTDLELTSRHDLGPLVAALEASRLETLHHKRVAPDVDRASFEAPGRQSDPESTLVALLDVIEALDAQARTLWNSCQSRVFDLGFASGRASPSLHLALTPATLARVVAVGGALAVSIYPVDEKMAPNR